MSDLPDYADLAVFACMRRCTSELRGLIMQALSGKELAEVNEMLGRLETRIEGALRPGSRPSDDHYQLSPRKSFHQDR
jgi:hypothetical protein